MRRTFTVDDALVPIDLLRSAIDHLGAAEQLFGSSASYFDSAGYLAHLAVECLLKAWLLQVAGKFVDSHKLRGLYDEIIKSHGGPALSAQQKAVVVLLDKFGQLRYPNKADPTEVGTDDLPAIKALMQALYERLPDELLEKLDRVDVLQKGGRTLMKKKIEAP
jgi:HEPN domain-containing protein